MECYFWLSAITLKMNMEKQMFMNVNFIKIGKKVWEC